MFYKKILIPATMLLLVIFTQCKKSNSDGGIRINECSSQWSGANICVDSLVDNRCPPNAICVWSGYAAVRVSFRENNNTHNFRMSIPTLPGVGTRDTTINGYHIIFVEQVGDKAYFKIEH